MTLLHVALPRAAADGRASPGAVANDWPHEGQSPAPASASVIGSRQCGQRLMDMSISS
jgi:hypothetical protein